MAFPAALALIKAASAKAQNNNSGAAQNAQVRQAAQQNMLGDLGRNVIKSNPNPYAAGMGSLGDKAVASNPYAAPQQQSNGWGNTQKYLGTVAGLQSQNSGGQSNGLSKVLGLVGLFK
jgi:hypothetical protein